MRWSRNGLRCLFNTSFWPKRFAKTKFWGKMVEGPHQEGRLQPPTKIGQNKKVTQLKFSEKALKIAFSKPVPESSHQNGSFSVLQHIRTFFHLKFVPDWCGLHKKAKKLCTTCQRWHPFWLLILQISSFGQNSTFSISDFFLGRLLTNKHDVWTQKVVHTSPN